MGGTHLCQGFFPGPGEDKRGIVFIQAKGSGEGAKVSLLSARGRLQTVLIGR